MWKHGFLIADTKEESRPVLIEFRAVVRFQAHHLFRKCGGHPTFYVYVKKATGERELRSMLRVENYSWFGSDQIFLHPGEKLLIAVSGVKKKEHAFMIESISVNEHGENDKLERFDRQYRILHDPKVLPFESFKHHKWC